MTAPVTTLRPQSGPIPFAPPSALTEPFWTGCAEGELRYQRCESCGRAEFPPTERCRACQSGALHWQASGGLGAVYSWTIVHRAVTPAFQAPYAPAIVTLDEGWQLMTNLVDMDIEDVSVDLPVQVRFVAVADGLTLPYFARRDQS